MLTRERARFGYRATLRYEESLDARIEPEIASAITALEIFIRREINVRLECNRKKGDCRA